ncbi:Protein AEXR-1 [Aphelenchoides avenae]|nr:Protein AEXR-1 [Aphelenchus avenae]
MDKFVYFRWPLRYLVLSTKRAVLLVGLAWGVTIACVACVWSFGVAYIHSDQLGTYCQALIEPRMRIIYHIFIVCFCIVPVVSSLLLSLYLARLTSARRQRMCPRGNVFNADKLKSLALILTTTAWTSVTLLPYRIWYFITALTIVPDSSCADIKLRVEMSSVLVLFLYLNPVVNPLLTLLVHAPYRRLIKEKASLAYERMLAIFHLAEAK